MKDIKTKGPVQKTIKTLGKSLANSERMKDAFIRTKEKAENAYSSNENSASEYWADSVSHGANRTTDEAIHAGNKVGRWGFEETKKNVSSGIKKYNEKKAQKTATDIGAKTNKSIKTLGKTEKTIKQSLKKSEKTIKTTAKGSVKTAQKSVKTAEKTARTTIKTTGQTAKAAAKTAQATAKTAQKAAGAAKVAAKAATQAAKATVKAVIATVKTIIVAVKGLVALIAAGGWIAVIIIIILCLVGLIVGSGFGIFYSNDPMSPDSIPITRAVSDLNAEFYDRIETIENNENADVVNVVTNGEIGYIKWDEVLAIYAVKTTTDEANGMYVAQMDEGKKDVLRNVMNDMNKITHSTKTTTKEVTVTDEDGNETTETITEKTLTITITHTPYRDMFNTYNFNASQKTQAEEMLSEQNRILWAQLLGGYIGGSGQIIVSGADFIPIGRFSYPLPSTFTITSLFGYRNDPFTGETKYHSGLDIGAPERTPILAADDGKVIIANATDSWGGGYGYHVKIEHTDGYATLYAHCFGIAVTNGQQVIKGEVIGYVGTTGRSTGNHLHFEVYKNGERVDPLSFFRQ